MGYIVDDHDKGVHGELRRESFLLFSDYGKEWSVELELDKLDEVAYVVGLLIKARDVGMAYPGQRRVTIPDLLAMYRDKCCGKDTQVRCGLCEEATRQLKQWAILEA